MAAAMSSGARSTRLKKEASAVLNGMGLSLSDAIRLMLVRVARKGRCRSRFACRTGDGEAMLAAERGEVVEFGSVGALFDDLNDCAGPSR